MLSRKKEGGDCWIVEYIHTIEDTMKSWTAEKTTCANTMQKKGGESRQVDSCTGALSSKYSGMASITKGNWLIVS
jgi:hypothetical protein